MEATLEEGGGIGLQGHIPRKIAKKPEGENCLDHSFKSPPMANHGTKLGV